MQANVLRSYAAQAKLLGISIQAYVSLLTLLKSFGDY